MLDLTRKVRLLTGASLFGLHAEPAIGLPALQLSDGPTGVRGAEFTGGRVTCLLPNATLLAQHWNPEITREAAEILADEAVEQGVHVVLGPTINLHRTALGGRLFEAYSEDPYLTGVLATAYVRGLQDRGVGATPKHFLANESETERHSVNSVVDAKTLREVYLLPFQMVVDDADPWAIMAAYNKVNGIPSTEHAELVEGVLKCEWGYRGLVMSDWFATTSAVQSANGGLDLVMPGPDGPWGQTLVDAVQAGEVAEATIDDHLARLRRLAELTRDPGPASGLAPDSVERRAQLRRIAAGGMTVLVNKSVLPLAAGGRVAVIGRHAVDTVAMGGGSAQVRPPHVVSIADGLVTALGAEHVSVVDGVEVRERHVAPSSDLLRDPETGLPGIRATTFDAAGAVIESRHLEVAELAAYGGWTEGAAQIELTADVVLPAAQRMLVGVRGMGDWTVRIDGVGHHASLDFAGNAFEGLLKPPAWTTEVEVGPGTRLVARNHDHSSATILGFVLRPVPPAPAEAIGAAVRAAREADVAVVVVGLTQEQETEGLDKATLALPGEQDALVAAVAAAARKTVVVVNAATPVLMPWLAQVDAVLWAGLPGQEAGDAVAAALLGHVVPEGRLVTTFPRRDADALSPVPVDGDLAYSEGTSIGYRGAVDPLFWFGHGLGYTTWEYGAAKVSTVDGLVDSVSVELTNSGPREGREVVQVYLRPADPAEPVRLIGFASAGLRPGESALVEVPCADRMQRAWSVGWQSLSGGRVLVARGLGDIRVTLPVDQE